jgi:MFS family permease
MADTKAGDFEHVDVSTTLTQDEQTGEQLFELERQYSLWKAVTMHKRILVYCIAAFGAGGVFGYDTIANGATVSMPSFMLYFGAMTPEHELYVPSLWVSLWTAMSYLLQAMGGFMIGFVNDRLGRKWPCVGACLLSVAGVGVQYGATSRAMLLGGKMINGFAIGCLFATATAWASEISPMRLRGPIQSAIILFMFFMQAIGLVVVRLFVPNLTPAAFRTVFAVQWAWPITTGLLFVFLPESPTWLLLKGRTEAAKRSLQRLYGPHNNIQARLAHMALGIRLEEEQALRHGTGSYIDLFRGSNLKRTLTVVWMFLGFGFTGACLLAQSVYFLIIAGLEPIHSYDVAIGGFAIAILAIIGSWFFMEKSGRRSMFLIGAGGNCITMFVIGGLYYTDKKGALWAVAVIMFVTLPIARVCTNNQQESSYCMASSEYRLTCLGHHRRDILLPNAWENSSCGCHLKCFLYVAFHFHSRLYLQCRCRESWNPCRFCVWRRLTALLCRLLSLGARSERVCNRRS